MPIPNIPKSFFIFSIYSSLLFTSLSNHLTCLRVLCKKTQADDPKKGLDRNPAETIRTVTTPSDQPFSEGGELNSAQLAKFNHAPLRRALIARLPPFFEANPSPTALWALQAVYVHQKLIPVVFFALANYLATLPDLA